MRNTQQACIMVLLQKHFHKYSRASFLWHQFVSYIYIYTIQPQAKLPAGCLIRLLATAQLVHRSHALTLLMNFLFYSLSFSTLSIIYRGLTPNYNILPKTKRKNVKSFTKWVNLHVEFFVSCFILLLIPFFHLLDWLSSI